MSREVSRDDINIAVFETQIRHHEYTCSRCDERSTLVKYGAAFCSDNCAERASDFTLEDGQRRVPEYTEDLREMHEVEMTLTDDNREDYWSNLAFICERDFKATGDKRTRQSASATGIQRTEAYLRTLSKWPPNSTRN